MVFSSNLFLFAFLPLTLLCYFVIAPRARNKGLPNIILLIASLIFYSWGEGQYIILLLISIAANYYFGILIARSIAVNLSLCNRNIGRDLVIFIAIAFNLILLAYFKYANFLVENINQLLAIFGDYEISLNKVHLPIGISFFTFHAISYLVDIYRQKCQPQKNFLNLALYISFFPQLVAGPIVRYNFIEKYLSKRRYNFFFVSYGVRRFIIGLGKKVIIANPLGEMADVIFASNASDLSMTVAWIGIICYSLQIYFDFSGYSDMAVGLARIFGFRFPENFNYPYISRSIKEFWRRWHISLSSWFRDYVYIPLGGNRVNKSRQYFNLVLVFFLCGLWHGASWNFIIWGMFHGSFLVLERLITIPNYIKNSRNIIVQLLPNLYAIFVVMIAWVFFRSPDLGHALSYLGAMFVEGNGTMSQEVSRLLRSHFLWMSFILALIGFSPLVKKCSLKLIRKNTIFLVLSDIFLILCLFLVFIRLSAATHNPFIYFQF